MYHLRVSTNGSTAVVPTEDSVFAPICPDPLTYGLLLAFLAVVLCGITVLFKIRRQTSALRQFELFSCAVCIHCRRIPILHASAIDDDDNDDDGEIGYYNNYKFSTSYGAI